MRAGVTLAVIDESLRDCDARNVISAIVYTAPLTSRARLGNAPRRLPRDRSRNARGSLRAFSANWRTSCEPDNGVGGG